MEGRSSAGSTTVSGAWTTYPPNEAGDSLYCVLGVPRDATREEIDAAFLRFRYRDVSEYEVPKPINMDRVEYAYSVLSDQLKRSLYNKFGEQTLRMIENRYALAAADWLGLHIAALVASVITFILVLLTFILIITMALKFDGRSSASWPVVMLPLWFYWTLLHATVFGFAVFRKKRLRQNPAAGATCAVGEVAASNDLKSVDPALAIALPNDDTTAMVVRRFEGGFMIFVLIAYTIASIFGCIVAEVDGIPGWAPLLACALAELPFAVRTCLLVNPVNMEKELARRGVATIRPVLLWLLTGTQFVRGIYWLAMWILLALRVVDVVTCSLFILFIPVYIAMICSIVGAWTVSKAMQENHPENQEGPCPIVQHVLWHCTMCACMLGSVVLLTLRIDDTVTISFLVCAVPLLFFTFLVLLVFAFAIYKAATLTIDAPTSDPDEEFAVVAHRNASSTHHHTRIEF